LFFNITLPPEVKSPLRLPNIKSGAHSGLPLSGALHTTLRGMLGDGEWVNKNYSRNLNEVMLFLVSTINLISKGVKIKKERVERFKKILWRNG
jgi:hypothetical protein